MFLDYIFEAQNGPCDHADALCEYSKQLQLRALHYS